jgi:diguanylate cyclase (GGDEF)-like protein
VGAEQVMVERVESIRAPRTAAELISAAVAVAAILLFVGTATRALTEVRQAGQVDDLALSALLLNLALLIFAWRRHADARRHSLRRRAAEERARTLATRDQLTSLLVRGALLESGREVARIAAGASESLCVIVLNLDRFKHVNEVYGHIAGDALLRAAAGTIVDTAGRSSLVARIGADEFCLACTAPEGGEKEVQRLAERLVQLLAEPFEFNTVAIHVSASAGLAHVAPDCADFEAVLRRAAIALAAAKKAGGNRAIWFDASMESALRARNDVEAGLRRGIPLGEFVPYYQPQVDLESGRVRGMEALARWNHPAGGVVGPDLFIPIAEETGLIADLFESICAQALADAKAWDSSLTLSVNISPVQLKDPWLAQKILRRLVEAGFPPERLEIEITESSLFENLALAQAIVASLKNQGVRLALDDFGTGYSSLANLRALPFDRIKIDRGFVQAMEQDRESLAIVTAIAKMGESLGVPVTAEGVTGETVRHLLLSIGCDMGQGWLFGKPLSAPEAKLLLAMQGLIPETPECPAAPAPPLPVPAQRRA